MKRNLVVGEITSILEGGVLVLGLTTLDGGYVILQREINENLLGADPPYFEINDQINGGYDLVDSLVIDWYSIDVSLCRPIAKIDNFVIDLSNASYGSNMTAVYNFKLFSSDMIKLFEGYENKLKVMNRA